MQCPKIPEIPYGDFSERLHRQGVEQQLPLAASVELTERCNLNCVHCYINRPVRDREVQALELTTKQWQELLDQMAAAGTLWLLFTGGEPLLRSDFKKIYLHAKQLGMLITLFTNGTLITPEFADFLAEWPPFLVEVTVYGHSPGTYESVTQSSASHARCLQGIELLLVRGLPLELKTMVMTLNIGELWDLKAWAKGLGVRFRYDSVINTRLDGCKDPLTFRLTPEQVVALESEDTNRLKELQDFVTQYSGSLDSDFLYLCGAGKTSFHVDASGKMSICMMSRQESLDLTRNSFLNGWREFLPVLRGQKSETTYYCGHCELLSLCGQCPAWAQLEHGDPETPVAHLCHLAHLRAQMLGLDFQRKWEKGG